MSQQWSIDALLELELVATADGFPMEGLGRLGVHLPLVWVEEALAWTGMASVRRRRLSAEQVDWLVIALTLFRRTSMSEVLKFLDLALPNGEVSAVSWDGISQARQRLGSEPLAVLFERTSRAWSTQDVRKHGWMGLSLWAMDGRIFRTPDSPENRATFGAQGYASGKAASSPQVGGVTLSALPTRLVADAAFGEYDINEMRYAEELGPRIQHELLFAAAKRVCGNIPGTLHRLREQLKEALKEERRGRQCPHHVKSSPLKYDVRFVFKTRSERDYPGWGPFT